jgi:hypothetical protein
MSTEPLHLRVEVQAAPEPALLRAAIAARIAGRPFPPGPDDAVARAVAEAVAERLREVPAWR